MFYVTLSDYLVARWIGLIPIYFHNALRLPRHIAYIFYYMHHHSIYYAVYTFEQHVEHARYN